MNQDTVLVVDYHDARCVIRTVDGLTGNHALRKIPTTASSLLAVADEAAACAQRRGGKAVWVQESTTGWARVKQLVQGKAEFLLANVLQMPLPPKAQRRKTDQVDTARLAREYLNGQLPTAYQPDDSWRQLRRWWPCGRAWLRGGPRCKTGSIAISRMKRGRIAGACGHRAASSD